MVERWDPPADIPKAAEKRSEPDGRSTPKRKRSDEISLPFPSPCLITSENAGYALDIGGYLGMQRPEGGGDFLDHGHTGTGGVGRTAGNDRFAEGDDPTGVGAG